MQCLQDLEQLCSGKCYMLSLGEPCCVNFKSALNLNPSPSLVPLRYFESHGEPLFSSHMLDLSEEPIEENIEICDE